MNEATKKIIESLEAPFAILVHEDSKDKVYIMPTVTIDNSPMKGLRPVGGNKLDNASSQLGLLEADSESVTSFQLNVRNSDDSVTSEAIEFPEPVDIHKIPRTLLVINTDGKVLSAQKQLSNDWFTRRPVVVTASKFSDITANAAAKGIEVKAAIDAREGRNTPAPANKAPAAPATAESTERV